MPINASPHFEKAQAKYEQAQTIDQKIMRLKKMISLAPGHKGAENLRAQLKRRLARLKYAKDKEVKSGKSTFVGIKKDDMQAIIVGFSNVGKSSLLSLLTNATPQISEMKFTTTEPKVGVMKYETVNIQIIENPSIDSQYFDKGLPNTADTILIVVENFDDIKNIEKYLDKSKAKKIVVFNKIDKLDENEKRKLFAKLQSKRYNFVLISCKTKKGIDELKDKLFQSFDKIRVYTKEPGKEKSNKPIILEPGVIVKDVAEKILKGFSEKIKDTKIWGPSSKFPGQKVGLKHELKDLDVIEFKTK